MGSGTKSTKGLRKPIGAATTDQSTNTKQWCGA